MNAAMAYIFKAQTTLAEDSLNEEKSCFDNKLNTRTTGSLARCYGDRLWARCMVRAWLYQGFLENLHTRWKTIHSILCLRIRNDWFSLYFFCTQNKTMHGDISVYYSWL